MSEIKQYHSANELPKEWDERAENYFQRKSFLLHAEQYNSCQQRYYVLYNEGVMTSGAIMYSLRLDILTYLKLKSPIKMNIVGVPCSVSSSGIFGAYRDSTSLIEEIYKKEKGFVLALNLKKNLQNGIASGKTLPTIVLENNFKDWNGYLMALRSSYRRRINRIEAVTDITFEKLSCNKFTTEMHQQYLNVYNRSEGKLEKLSFEFFKNLPPEFMLTTARNEGKLLGWNIALHSDNTYYFFLGGIDYKYNRENNTYLRLLTKIIKDGIETKVKLIDLGQTAEVPKMRLGGKPQVLNMEAKHSNSIFNFFLKKFSGKLEYQIDLEENRTMKEEGL